MPQLDLVTQGPASVLLLQRLPATRLLFRQYSQCQHRMQIVDIHSTTLLTPAARSECSISGQRQVCIVSCQIWRSLAGLLSNSQCSAVMSALYAYKWELAAMLYACTWPSTRCQPFLSLGTLQSFRCAAESLITSTRAKAAASAKLCQQVSTSELAISVSACCTLSAMGCVAFFVTIACNVAYI